MSESVLTYTPTWDVLLKAWKRFEPICCREAARMQQLAVHWKDPPTLVGGAALAHGPGGWEILLGCNYKPFPGDTDCPRCCMEEEIEAWAMLKGCETIVGLATAASYQLDDETHRDMRGTLPLCYRCRERIYQMVRNGELYYPETRIVAQRIDIRYPALEPVRYTIAEHMVEFPLGECTHLLGRAAE